MKEKYSAFLEEALVSTMVGLKELFGEKTPAFIFHVYFKAGQHEASKLGGKGSLMDKLRNVLSVFSSYGFYEGFRIKKLESGKVLLELGNPICFKLLEIVEDRGLNLDEEASMILKGLIQGALTEITGVELQPLSVNRVGREIIFLFPEEYFFKLSTDF